MFSWELAFRSPLLVAHTWVQHWVPDSLTEQRVDEWIQGVSRLSSFDETQPHASYAAFTHGYLSKWNYFFRTTPNISNRLSPLESAVRSHFLPKLVLYPVGDIE